MISLFLQASVFIEEEKFLPAEILFMILIKMKEMAESDLGTNINDADATVLPFSTRLPKMLAPLQALMRCELSIRPQVRSIAYGLDKMTSG